MKLPQTSEKDPWGLQCICCVTFSQNTTSSGPSFLQLCKHGNCHYIPDNIH